MTTTTALTEAIARSRSHNEIVRVEVEAANISEVLAELATIYDGEIDDSQENDGTYGVWGWTEDMAEGEMDWRLNVTLTTPKLVKVIYWVGTTQREGLAANYAEAMEFASRNQNAHDPKFYEIATGEQLYDDGNGLRAESDDHYTC